jgi:hypothetical protein
METMIVQVPTSFLKDLDLYRSLLERGHTKRGTPRIVDRQEALVEAAKLGVSTAGIAGIFMGIARKKIEEQKQPPGSS